MHILQSLSLYLSAFADHAKASIFDGPGLTGGVDEAGNISGPLHMSLRDFILLMLYKVLNFLALAAVVMIVAAGIYLVFSGGSDSVKDTVKKMVLYVIIGLIIVLFARAVVGFFMYGFPY